MSTDTRTRTSTADPGAPGGAFSRLAGWAQRHRWGALVLWIVALVVISAAAQGAGDAYRNDFSLPGTETQAATDVLKEHGSLEAGDTVQIVLSDSAGLAGERQRVEGLLEKVGKLPSVAQVRSPYEDTVAVSEDGTVGYATVTLKDKAEAIPPEDIERIIDTARAGAGQGLRVELGGEAIRAAQEEAGGGAEFVGMFVALVLLVLLFGSLVAAALPLITTIFAVGGATGLIALASHVATVADFTPPMMTLVGLGVGVDYALLVFYRFRTELIDGADPATAGRVALDAAGRTVFFAGCTVIIGLLGLVTLGIGSLQGVALAVALTVLATMAAALVLLPALLALFGRRLQRTVEKRSAKARSKGRTEGAGWRRLASGVQRRPLAALAAALVAMLALSLPALDMRLGFADAASDPAGSTSRKAYDLLADGFGPGFNGPLVIVADGGNNAGQALSSTLDGAEGVAAATPPLPSEDGKLATVIAYPDSSPQDEDTTALVHRLRDDVLPPVERETGARFLVGGSTAAAQDFSDTVSGRLPLFVLIVVGLSTLLLVAVFRSVLVPLKAAVLNLLSISAALGVVTLVFQKGWLGVEPGPVEAFNPVMIFAIVFGLSMDYEVFLVTRIREEWERTHDAAVAVREGLARTGRVITAAAAVMIVVFGGFVLSPARMMQQFGLGLAVAILLDALVIRCLMVPAVMQLMGRSAWWLPAPLAKVLPEVKAHGV
ncbi:Membrane protein YdfJ [Streptomyces sp. RB5]|uniref:Membrane protein YdfJ n=1 Tax=Streptomyces smaragdinus TaxID=2585196 RepID=A0A7K0CDU8_9ACTN|nr:MMPL family transporter [Streptomyces smaragdinus]MQY11620.1 Membrane protein YdfJ [Streptomyces smaragdinus]